MKFFISLCILLGESTLASSALFKYVRGTVTVERSGVQIQVLKNSEILENDIIRTSKKSFALIKFPSGTQIKVDPKSKLTVKNYIREFNFNLDRGGTIFQVKKRKDIFFKVNTRTASMGVRGTTFYINQSKNSDLSWACVKEGSIEVIHNKSNKKVIVNEGLGVSVEDNISKPEALAWTRGINWNLNESDKGINNVKITGEYNILNFDYE